MTEELKPSAPERMELSRLLISQSEADWLKTIDALIGGFADEQLAIWWCDLNARQWPDQCPLRPLDERPEQWSKDYFFTRITEKVPDRYLVLQWRARYCAGFVQADAQARLTFMGSQMI